ncbi:hypothetical protein [Blastococcus sp. PRF04-17]|nr:hypothetical protein [Blastococcus sp. PRF04-17]UOY03354.1 hypothetical protein MVA48_08480 [Blastococcus sp. PRF04-17]
MTDPAPDLDALAVSPSAFRLDGRHVVVTGGGRGIGQGIAVSAARAAPT